MGRLISEFYGNVNSEETEGSSDRSNENTVRVKVVSLLNISLCPASVIILFELFVYIVVIRERVAILNGLSSFVGGSKW